MIARAYGNPDASRVLIQPVDDHDLDGMADELAAIRRATDDFWLIALKVDDWNADLSPWAAPPVFGSEGFGGGAQATLDEALKLCPDDGRPCIIGGYSLAGLFALWAAHRTDRFAGVAAASPSVWFPGFADFMRAHPIRCRRVYLSLGDREERTRNRAMATVGDRIREVHARLEAQGIACALEWNPGNHFRDAALRTAKAFVWAMGM